MSSAIPPHTKKVLDILSSGESISLDQVKEIYKTLENYKLTEKMIDKIKAKCKEYKDLFDKPFLNRDDIRWILTFDVPIDESLESLFKCDVCGKPTHVGGRGGWKSGPVKMCSSACILKGTKEKRQNSMLQKYGTISAFASKDIREKIKKTNLERYGAENPYASDQIKEKIKQTTVKKYGVDNVLKSKEIRQKGRQTNLERYGAEIATQSEQIKEKIKQTNQIKYGGNGPLCSAEVREKVYKTNLKKRGIRTNFDKYTETGELNKNGVYLSREKLMDSSYKRLFTFDKVEPAFSREEWQGFGTLKSQKLYKWRCKECGKTFDAYVGGPFCPPRCYDCHPHSVSKGQEELEAFINSLGFKTARNDRKTIKPLEIDILLPEQKIGFEYNGEFYHQDNGPLYHKNKTELAEAKGVHLIHIFETEWIHYRDLIKTQIKNLLCESEITAEECIIKEVGFKERQEFLNQYHINGDSNSTKVALGLYKGEELISLMIFSKSWFNQAYEYELARYCSVKKVVGGFSKLLKHFEETYHPKSLISYADRKWVNKNDNIYERNGFNLHHISEPSFFYTKPKNPIIIKRYQVQKPKMLLGDNYDPNLTVKENMEKLGFVINYDCGNLVYEKIYK